MFGLPCRATRRNWSTSCTGSGPTRSVERPKLVQFLVGEWQVDGRDMSLPADAGERAEFLNYLDLWGGDTRQADHKGTAVFSYWYHLTDPTTMYVLHAAFLGVCVLFTIGLWTRVTSVLAWVGSLELHPPRAARPVRPGHDADDPAGVPDDRAERGGPVGGRPAGPVPGGPGPARVRRPARPLGRGRPGRPGPVVAGQPGGPPVPDQLLPHLPVERGVQAEGARRGGNTRPRG